MNFSEVKQFQVKPDRLEEFEELIKNISKEQKAKEGCINIKYIKRFYVIDMPNPPRELTKIVKCVKYYSYWEFNNKENYSDANNWFFENYSKQIFKLLIMPFDIYLGYNLV
jgi:hypothetical protein